MEESTIVGLVADEPDFETLRPDLREAIRQQELELREALVSDFSSFPEHWVAALTPMITIGVPRRFVRSLLPFFTSVGQAMDLVELNKKQKLLNARAQGGRRPH